MSSSLRCNMSNDIIHVKYLEHTLEHDSFTLVILLL